MNANDLLLEAELMGNGPERVFEIFERRQESTKLSLFMHDGIESALLTRGLPLIDLALTRYGACASVVRILFERANTNDRIAKDHSFAPESSALSSGVLRVAVLSNQVFGKKALPGGMPGDLFGVPFGASSFDYLIDFINGAQREELKTPLLNPTVSRGLLEALYLRKVPFAGLSDEAWRVMIVDSAGSECLHRGWEENGAFDGWGEHMHKQLFEAAWSLALTVPVEKIWADTLCILLVRTSSKIYGVDKWVLLDRWRKSKETPSGNEDEQVRSGVPEGEANDNFFQLRLVLSRLWSKHELHGLGSSEEKALRCRLYGEYDCSLEEIQEGFDRDKGDFIDRALENLSMWRKPASRELLMRLCKTLDPKDLYCQSQFR